KGIATIIKARHFPFENFTISTGAATGLGQAVKAGTISKSMADIARTSSKALQAASAAVKSMDKDGKVTSWTSVVAAYIAGPSGSQLDGSVGPIFQAEGLQATFLQYGTPWLGLVETYVREGELSTDDWLGAIASTVGTVIDANVKTGGFEGVAQRSALKALAGGAIGSFSDTPDFAFGLISNSVGNELGNYLGHSIVQATSLTEQNQKIANLVERRRINNAIVDKLEESYKQVTPAMADKLHESVANGEFDQGFKSKDMGALNAKDAVYGAFEAGVGDDIGTKYLSAALVEDALTNPESAALLYGVMIEETTHQLASAFEKELGIKDLLGDEGALVARQLMIDQAKDLAAQGRQQGLFAGELASLGFSFSTSIDGQQQIFNTSLGDLAYSIPQNFGVERLLADLTDGTTEFSKNQERSFQEFGINARFTNMAVNALANDSLPGASLKENGIAEALQLIKSDSFNSDFSPYGLIFNGVDAESLQNQIRSKLQREGASAAQIEKVFEGLNLNALTQQTVASAGAANVVVASNGPVAIPDALTTLASNAAPVLETIGEGAIELAKVADKWYVEYAMMALDIAAGPVKFAVGKAIEYAVGDEIGAAAGYVLNKVGSTLVENGVIDDPEKAGKIALGVVATGMLIVGARVALKNMPELVKGYKNLLSKLRKSPDRVDVPDSTRVIDKSWKQKIEGTAQATGDDAAHQIRTYREAITLAKDPDVISVNLDHGYNRALRLDPKTIAPNRRPDVTAVYSDGRVARVEVQSETDVPAILRSRNAALDAQIRAQGFTP
ncbi:hypothetical protein, partial [Vibrio sp.]|uniref:hypothetical protein n=1 Tax=Vibrio sp. TaxID=678 RepID=UPI003D0F257A